jgi:RHS repeat-associated protein
MLADCERWVLSGGHYVARYNYFFFSDGSGTHSKITDPIGRIYRTDVSTDGLTQTSRVWANTGSYGSDGSPGPALKTSTTVYVKDANGMRPVSSTITDGGATKKTAIEYTIIEGVLLPWNVIEYENGGSNVYRHTRTEYMNDSDYNDRHIFGLVVSSHTYQGASFEEANLIAGKYFYYDTEIDETDFTVVQHDPAYGPGFLLGRGNLSEVHLVDVQTSNPQVWRKVSQTKHDKTGMVVSVSDATNHTTQFYYEDNFLAGQGVGQTHALPTRVKDPDSFWSGAKYDWYTGNVVENYHIAGTSGTGTHQNVVSYGYDPFDRPLTTTRPDGGVTTLTYWDNWRAVGSLTGIDVDKTRYGYVISDGTGRTIWQGGDHPDGVSGKHQTQKILYDSVGRVSKTSHPIETNGSFGADGNITPTGDDEATGYLMTQIQYDALDRQDFITHPDGNNIDYAYTGCGCAGSSQINIRDERARLRILKYDFLGRMSEAQELNRVTQAIYSRARYSYDALDRLLKIEHFNGASGSGPKQERTFSYDAFGRLLSQTTPEAGTVNYEYWDNDLVKKVTDARGISGQFTYNNRNLVTDVDYSDATPDVHYEYGEYGERTLMQEKNGSTVIGQTSYSYDTFKRLQSETRQFQGLSGTYRVSYGYNLVDALKQVTYTANSWTKSVNYDYSNAGAPAKIGTNLNPLAGVSDNVMKNLNYRAFGALKSGDYGNGRRIELGYNADRLNMTSHKVIKQSPFEAIIDNVYDYYDTAELNNGRVQKITDNLDSNFTTTYGYDDYDRLTSATATSFGRTFSYDAWGNLTNVAATGAGESGSYSLSYATNGSGAPLNNRISNTGHQYDTAGNMIQDPALSYTYDAANRLKTAGVSSSYGYDGDGWKVKQVSGAITVYYLWSSVLGQPVVELTSGGVNRAYVYSGGGQVLGLHATDQQFYWVHTDHLGSGKMMTNATGAVVYRGQFDPHGQMVYEWASDGQMNKNSHKFTGYERDAGADLDYAKARMYSRFKGRFMSPDPLGLGAADLTNPQSLNLYSYVRNDPMNATDPSGMMIWPEDISVGGGGGGATCQEFVDAVNFSGWYLPNSWCGSGSGSGSGSGGGNKPKLKKPKNRGTQFPQGSEEECNKLRNEIESMAKELDNRKWDLEQDPLNLVPGGFIDTPKIMPDGTNAGHVKGHQQKFNEEQVKVNDKINYYNDRCKNGPPLNQAWKDIVKIPAPSRTRPILTNWDVFRQNVREWLDNLVPKNPYPYPVPVPLPLPLPLPIP